MDQDYGRLIKGALSEIEDFGDVSFRRRKLESQMQEYGFDFLDVMHVVKNHSIFEHCSKEDVYRLGGKTIDGKELWVTLVIKEKIPPKIINAWQNI